MGRTWAQKYQFQFLFFYKVEYQYVLILLFRQRAACSSDLISIHFLEIFQTAGSSDVSIDTFEEQTRLNIDHLKWF